MAFSFRNRQIDHLSSTMAPTGFWGEVTASLDWCENNYDVSYYIAEFWNTISNMAFVVPSLLAAYFVFRLGYERKFALAHLGVALIGVGSALFHLTLKYTMQLADELPMLYGTSVLLYCAIESPKPKGQPTNVPLAVSLAVVSVVTTIAYIVTRDPAIFFGMYGLLTATTVILGTRLIILYGTCESRWIGGIALSSYAFGFGLWAFENNHCPIVQDVRYGVGPLLGVATQLHAWWHLFAAVGGYLLVIFFLHIRLSVKASGPRLVYRYNILPLVYDADISKYTETSAKATRNGIMG